MKEDGILSYFKNETDEFEAKNITLVEPPPLFERWGFYMGEWGKNA